MSARESLPLDPAEDLAEAPTDEVASPAVTTRGLQTGAATAGRVERFWLTAVAGPSTGVTLASAAERVVIGTHPSADLVLEDDTVSRFHCELALSGSRVLLRDLGSRNGTTVGGVSVLAAHLGDGCSIRLGRSEIRFELRSETVQLPLHPEERFGRMAGRSVAMRRAFALLARAAGSDSAVLIEGETGTGKELAAESVHVMSDRRDGPLVVVDCSALPPDLLASELFGHERGAFTGASSAREGAFEAASGGTIFLDEIGELGLDLQPNLLRVLERKQIKRVGSNRYLPVDVRIIAATNRNLRREVNERRFRSDLYYRLAVLELRLPSLRERLDDLSLLVGELLSAMGVSDGDAGELTSPEFMAELARHRWPGNVRELRNYLERCLVLRARLPLVPDSSTTLPDFERSLPAAREHWNRELERRYVEELLARANGNVTAAARAAGVDRMYFYRLLWRYGLKARGRPS